MGWKKIDDFDVLKFSYFVILLLAVSTFIFSKINSVEFFFIAILLIRFSGQGMMSHTATTTISRYFTNTRGKALSTGWFGLSSAEFLLPITIIYALTVIDWRNIWIIITIFIVLFLPMVSYFLVKEIKLSSRENDIKFIKNNIKNWKRSEVIRDYRFIIVALNMLAMPCIVTGIFVYQSFILMSKNWGEYVIAQSFMVYSVSSVLTLFVAGYLIDKFTSRKLLIYMNIPLLISLLILIYFQSPISSFFFLGLIGLSNGFANVLGSSTWAELYGVKFIGSIKALSGALMVFSTAFGTAFFGLLIDLNFSLEQISVICSAYILISLLLLLLIKNKLNPTIL